MSLLAVTSRRPSRLNATSMMPAVCPRRVNTTAPLAASGAVVFTLRGHTAGIMDVAFSRDGRRLVTASSDMTVRLWDPSVGKEVLVLRGHSGKVVGARFSPDGLYLASVCLGQ